jgi:hypothetical protein
MEELKITVTDGTEELVVRTGQASIIDPPVKVMLAGKINAPATFYLARKTVIEKDSGELNAHLKVIRRAYQIQLVLDEKELKGTTVTGQLKVNPDLEAFGVNGNRQFGQKEFTKLLRQNRRFFNDRGQYDKILADLSKFNYSQQKNGVNEDDQRGNSKALLEKKLTHNLQMDFVLNIPLFEGTDAVKFKVELIVDTETPQTAFWLESVDLIELLESVSNELIEKQLGDFTDSGIAIIEI